MSPVIDPARQGFYSNGKLGYSAFMKQPDLTSLQQKIDKLISINDELRQQNTALKVAEARWQAERSKLIQQNEVARKKVSDMIERLQVLERNCG